MMVYDVEFVGHLRGDRILLKPLDSATNYHNENTLNGYAAVTYGAKSYRA